MKKCSKCKLIKELREFSKVLKNKDGQQSWCRSCDNMLHVRYRKTEDGVITRMYSSQKSSSKTRGYKLPAYTKQELITWLYKNGFKELFDAWVDSGYKKELKPSADRLNDYKSYTFRNIQLITWKENSEKGHADSKAGITKKQLKAVTQYSKDNVFIKEFYSQNEASRQTGIPQSNICNCCKGKHKTAGGFKWYYKDLSQKG